MTDERIGIRCEKRPKLTICGHPLPAQSQFRFSMGIGNNQYVIVGYGDTNYEAEIEKLREANRNIPKRETRSGQSEAKSDSK